MLATLLNIPAGVYFFIAENLSKLLSSACNSSFSTPLASSILLFKESVISCKALSTSLLKNLAISVTLSLLVLGSKSRSTFCCSSTEVTFGVPKGLLSGSIVSSPLSVRKPSVVTYLLIGRAVIRSSFLSSLIKSLSSLPNGISSIDLLFFSCHNPTKLSIDCSVSLGNFLANSLISGVIIKQLI